MAIVSGGGDKVFFCISCDHMTNESLTRWVRYSHPKSQRLHITATEPNNKNVCVLPIGASLCYKIGAALFYYKLGQKLWQIGAASLVQIRTSVVTNWGSYYKLGQPLLQNRAATANCGKTCYKLGQVLQIRAIITNWGITVYAARDKKKYVSEMLTSSETSNCVM